MAKALNDMVSPVVVSPNKLDGDNDAKYFTTTFDASSSSRDAMPAASSGENLVQEPGVASVGHAEERDFEIPWQLGDGRREEQPREPVQLSDVVKGELEAQPWQF